MKYLFDIGKKRSVTAAGFMAYPSPTPHPSRCMEEHDLIYITEGEWSIRLMGETFRGKKDDVIVLPARLPHCAAGNCAAGTRTIFLHAAVSSGDGAAEEGRTPESGGAYAVTLGCHMNAAGRPGIKELFRRTAKSKLCGSERTASCCFDLLIDALCGIGARGSGDDLAGRVKELLVDAENAPTNAEIARKLGVSVRTAETAFRAATGTTIHAYLNVCRMDRARYYLEFHPEMKIADIADVLGFYDAYHFSRSFRAAFGLSPTAFRTEKFIRH